MVLVTAISKLLMSVEITGVNCKLDILHLYGSYACILFELICLGIVFIPSTFLLLSSATTLFRKPPGQDRAVSKSPMRTTAVSPMPRPHTHLAFKETWKGVHRRGLYGEIKRWWILDRGMIHMIRLATDNTCGTSRLAKRLMSIVWLGCVQSLGVYPLRISRSRVHTSYVLTASAARRRSSEWTRGRVEPLRRRGRQRSRRRR